jgi:cell division protein FtsX
MSSERVIALVLVTMVTIILGLAALGVIYSIGVRNAQQEIERQKQSADFIRRDPLAETNKSSDDSFER